MEFDSLAERPFRPRTFGTPIRRFDGLLVTLIAVPLSDRPSPRCIQTSPQLPVRTRVPRFPLEPLDAHTVLSVVGQNYVLSCETRVGKGHSCAVKGRIAVVVLRDMGGSFDCYIAQCVGYGWLGTSWTEGPCRALHAACCCHSMSHQSPPPRRQAFWVEPRLRSIELRGIETQGKLGPVQQAREYSRLLTSSMSYPHDVHLLGTANASQAIPRAARYSQ